MSGTRLSRVLAAGASSAAIVAVAARAPAAEGCARIVATNLPSTWLGAVAELRRQVEQLPPSQCRPMTLTIEELAGGVRIVALASDWARTERVVRAADSLVATALGLLMTIPGGAGEATDPDGGTAPPAPTALPSAAAAPPLPVTSESPAPHPSPDASPALSSTRAPTELWVGLSAGLRLTAPTDVFVLDVEARADLLLGSWLLLANVRSAVVSCTGQQGVDCDVYNDVSAGIGVGRRVRAGDASFDFAFEPSFVWMHMEYDYPPGSEDEEVEGSEIALRLDASARLVVPLGRKWICTVTLDGGLAPSMLVSPAQLRLPGAESQPPPFPAWSGGLRVGASGALL
jgi:hypothetical protein